MAHGGNRPLPHPLTVAVAATTMCKERQKAPGRLARRTGAGAPFPARRAGLELSGATGTTAVAEARRGPICTALN